MGLVPGDGSRWEEMALGRSGGPTEETPSTDEAKGSQGKPAVALRLRLNEHGGQVVTAPPVHGSPRGTCRSGGSGPRGSLTGPGRGGTGRTPGAGAGARGAPCAVTLEAAGSGWEGPGRSGGGWQRRRRRQASARGAASHGGALCQ